MMIKTSSWWTPLPAGHMRVGISRGVPRGHAAGYRLFQRLAPGDWFQALDFDAYSSRYQTEVLSRLDPIATAARLVELAGGGVPVLVCYERAGGDSWCHRAMAARWLSDALGQEVPEVGHEHLPQDAHPLLPSPQLI